MKKSRSLYLLLLLFLLLQGYHFIITKAQAPSQGQSSAETIRLNKLQTINKDLQKEFAYDYTLFSETNDDDDNSSGRKKILSSRFYESSAGISSLTALSAFSLTTAFNNNSFYLPHYKYIFHRTLRV